MKGGCWSAASAGWWGRGSSPADNVLSGSDCISKGGPHGPVTPEMHPLKKIDSQAHNHFHLCFVLLWWSAENRELLEQGQCGVCRGLRQPVASLNSTLPILMGIEQNWAF